MADVTTLSRPQKQTGKPYKVVFESVTEEKKPLRIVDFFSPRAPEGYTFVEIGSREITDSCKELSRKEGFQVYTVSNVDPRPLEHMDKLFYHNNRIGHHFRTDIVERVLGMLGRPVHHRFHNPSTLARLDRGLDRRRLSGPDAARAKAERERQVRDAIKELFPRIPAKDMDEILGRAFAEGTSTVGNADDLPLSKKVQLAVGAHIRHVYTAYDQLLRIVNREDARALIEDDCLTMLVAWRGEHQAYDEGFEEIFREVIVLEDDDTLPAENPESDIEIVSTKKLADTSLTLPRPVSGADDRNPLFKSQQGRGTMVHVQPIRPVRNANETISEAMQRKWKAAKNRPIQPEPTRRDKSIVIDLTAETPQVRRIRIGGDEFEIHPVQDLNSSPGHTHYALSQVKKLPPAFTGPDGVRFYEVPEPLTPSALPASRSGQGQIPTEHLTRKRRASTMIEENENDGGLSTRSILPRPASPFRFFEKPDASRPDKRTEFTSVGVYTSNAGRKRKSMPNMPTGREEANDSEGSRPQKRAKKSPRHPPDPARRTIRKTKSYIDTLEEIASRGSEQKPRPSTTSIATRRGLPTSQTELVSALSQQPQQPVYQAQAAGSFVNQSGGHAGSSYYEGSSTLPQVDLAKLLAQIPRPQA